MQQRADTAAALYLIAIIFPASVVFASSISPSISPAAATTLAVIASTTFAATAVALAYAIASIWHAMPGLVPNASCIAFSPMYLPSVQWLCCMHSSTTATTT